MRQRHQRITKRSKRKANNSRRKRQPTRKQRGGAFSIESVSRENEPNTIVTVRPDALEEDSVPLTTRLTIARRLLEETDTGA